MTANTDKVSRELSFEVVPPCEEHLGEAAALFGSAYRAAREHEPSLPVCHEDVGSILEVARRKDVARARATITEKEAYR